MTSGTVSSSNLTSLYSNTTSFTAGVVNSSVYSVNGGTGVTVSPTTGNVVVNIGQDVATSASVTFANVTATGNLSNNYYTLTNSIGIAGQVLTTNGLGVTTWTTPSSLGLVSSVTGSGAGISVSPTTGAVVVSNTGVTSIVAGTNISISGATGAVTINAIGILSGDVVGPASATDNAIARFDGTTGKLIQNSAVTIDDTTGNITTPGDLYVGGGDITSGAIAIANLYNSTAIGTINIGNSVVTEVNIGNAGSGRVFAKTPSFETQSNAIIGGDLTVTGTNISTGVTDSIISIDRTTSSTAVARSAVTLKTTTTGTPAVGLGTSINFVGQTAAANFENAGFIAVYSTDITPTAENFGMAFGLMNAGNTYTSLMDLDNLGNLQIGGDVAVNGGDITTTVTGQTNLFNTNTTEVNIGNAASTAVRIGSAAGVVNIKSPSLVQNPDALASTTFNLLNTITTDLNIGGAAITVDIGSTVSGTTTIGYDLVVNNGIYADFVTVDNQATLDSSTLTTTSTATVALNTSARNAMTGLINIIQGSNVHCLNYTALRIDASTAMITTYSEMYNTSSLASFTADVSGGSLRLLVTPTSATSTVFSVVRTSLT